MNDRKKTCTALLGAGLSAAVGALCGTKTPGLWGIVLYASMSIVGYRNWSEQRRPLWPLLVFIAVLMSLAVAPTRVLAISMRESAAMNCRLEAIALGLVAFWISIGAACASAWVFKKKPTLGERLTTSGAPLI